MQKGLNYRSFLMGVAIILITLHHFAIYGAGIPFSFFTKGNIGVDIFFFLSVYGCCFSFEKNTLTSFYLRRIKRLFPVYLIFLILFISLFRNNLGWRETICLVLPQITGLSILGFEEPIAWYIPSTILLYITFPISFFFFRSIERSFPLQVGFLFMVLIFAPKLPVLMNTALAMRIPIIFLGFLSFFNKDKEKHLVILYILALVVGYFIPNLFLESLVFPMILYCIGKGNIKLSSRVINFVGRHSLEIYLAQYIAIGTLFAERSYNYISDNLYIQLLCAFILLIFLSVVFSFSHRMFWRYFIK